MTTDNLTRGDWMQTYTGRAFYPLDPRPEDVNLIDISHALSLLCRYGGHVSRFYSVAEHCVLMSQAVSPEHALWALLHDATEAYMGDMIRPIKRSMPEYAAAEDRLMTVLCTRFDLDPVMPDEVRLADTRILHDERSILMTGSPQPWGMEHLDPLGVRVKGWDPSYAKLAYFARFHELSGA